jgi:8-oxo-dGTP diphosphatase
MPFCFACGHEVAGPPSFTCPRCSHAHWRNPRCCAGVLAVDREGRLLLVRRTREPWAGCWDIPGGYCEDGEHPETTAVRECWEETGLTVRVQGFFGIWVDPPASAAEVSNICIYYLAEVDASPADVDGFAGTDETDQIAFVRPSELPAAVAFPSHIPDVLQRWRAEVAR